ncbi:MAG TPA: RDD family protein [Acidobacteriota bacterium]|nr:RDD family protein [Acidobacteriota bacterium]
MVTRRCPCGYETRASFRTGDAEPGPVKPAVPPSPGATAAEREAARWRSQLERKFEQQREAFTAIKEAQRRIDDVFLSEKKEPGLASSETSKSTTVPDLDDQPSGPRLNDDDTVPTPASRHFPTKSTGYTQKVLSLEPFATEVAKPEASVEEEPSPISREIIFSRILAGMLDLLLPIVTAVLFVLAAAWLLDLDFFSSAATRSWLALAVGFHLLNSLYFFWANGRTPGMTVTGLRLVGEEEEEPSFSSVVVRVLLFLPVVVSIFGLAMALFDLDCRALHDRLSKTRIVPA